MNAVTAFVHSGGNTDVCPRAETDKVARIDKQKRILNDISYFLPGLSRTNHAEVLYAL